MKEALHSLILMVTIILGGPDQMDGYVIRELEGWLKEYKEISEGDSHLMLNWLNELDVVFYEIEGEIKCFVLKELD